VGLFNQHAISASPKASKKCSADAATGMQLSSNPMGQNFTLITYFILSHTSMAWIQALISAR
jgi:hypothetical protein